MCGSTHIVSSHRLRHSFVLAAPRGAEKQQGVITPVLWPIELGKVIVLQRRMKHCKASERTEQPALEKLTNADPIGIGGVCESVVLVHCCLGKAGGSTNGGVVFAVDGVWVVIGAACKTTKLAILVQGRLP